MEKNILDEIGPWSEAKLAIIRDYASEYSKILSAQVRPHLSHVYIDAFAGAGIHVSKTSGQYVPGSPLNALNVQPEFAEYHFIDIDRVKVKELHKLAEKKPNKIFIYEGDCNDILKNKIFPRVRYKDFRRGLCLLDPYGLQLDWEIIEMAGKMGSIEIFLNFPIADINRNVLLKNQDKVRKGQKERFIRFCGEYPDFLYSGQGNLFNLPEKTGGNEELARWFQKERLQKAAGFAYVPKPAPMRNSSNAIVYYLYFASPKAVAKNIVTHIFNNYKNKGQ